MILYYYVLLTVFGVIAALMITDPNISAYVDLRIRLIYINIRRLWILTTMYPSMMFDKWRFQRALRKHREKMIGRRD